MFDIIVYVFVFLAGLVLLLKGAGGVVRHASAMAKEAVISELIVGITLVAISTTLPEFSVSILAALSGVAEMATGTLLGSVIVNIGLVVGLPALIIPVKITKSHVDEGLIMIMFVIMASLFLYGGMHWYEGIWILLFMAFYLWILHHHIERAPIKAPKPETEKHSVWKIWKGHLNHHIIKVMLWGVVVFAGAQLLVVSTKGLAPMLGIAEYIIALLVIAVGTSLPELATSLVALIKGNRDLSLGNIMGANMFNIAILGLVSIISYVSAPPIIVMITIPTMILISALFLVFMRQGWSISRGEGLILFSVYIGFLASILA